VEAIYAELKVPLRVLDLAQMPPEIFSPSSYAEKPKAFAPFADAVLQAAGLHVVTPEYNGGIPGVLKYFIDMLKFPESFDRRPVCFTGLSAGIWGALRPVEQLQAIFCYRNAYLYPSACSFRALDSCSMPAAACRMPSCWTGSSSRPRFRHVRRTRAGSEIAGPCLNKRRKSGANPADISRSDSGVSGRRECWSGRVPRLRTNWGQFS
jgi:hypothetical protein